jgi:hypothetical protein
VWTNTVNETEAGRVDLPAMHDPGLYRLLVVGRLGPEWQDRFDGIDVVFRQGSDLRGITELTVPVSDQAALLGVLGQLTDMQCTLLRVELVNEQLRLGNSWNIEHGKKDCV